MNDLITKRTRNGKGVFTKRNLIKGEKIIKFAGKIFRRNELPSPYDLVDDHYVQIGRNLYMGPSGKLDDFFNHSCNPNSGLRINNKIVWLIAIKNIKKGEEIFWDYSTTMNEDDWELNCKCKSKNCRKKIRDFKYLPKNIKIRYINLGIVPDYAIK